MLKALRAVASLVIGLGGVAMMAWAINALLNTGTCATGGPYEVTNPCPPGSSATGFLLVGGFVAWFVGLFLSNYGFMRPGTGQIVWCALFLGGGVTVLVKALGEPTLGADSKLGSYIMAAVFIAIGLPVAIGPFVAAWRDRLATSKK
jgi:FtsH-binding integral membrane protein